MRAPTRTFVRAKTLRRSMTLPEVLLWRDLRRRSADGIHIRRQHAVGAYILDFYCSAARLAIEIDGSSHDHPSRAKRDIERDRWLKSQEIRDLRFVAHDILDPARRVDAITTIIAAAAAPSTMLRMVPLPRFAVEDEHESST